MVKQRSFWVRSWYELWSWIEFFFIKELKWSKELQIIILCFFKNNFTLQKFLKYTIVSMRFIYGEFIGFLSNEQEFFVDSFLVLSLRTMGGMLVENWPSRTPFNFLLLKKWRMQEVEDLFTKLINLYISNGNLEWFNPNPSLGKKKEFIAIKNC